MDNNTQEKALTAAIVDGALSAVMGSLAGGMFLTGFTLKVLNASVQQIGILASLPLLAGFSQLLGSYIIEKTGQKKKLCLLGVVSSRALWLIIILLPFKIFYPIQDFRIWVLVGVITLSSLLASLGNVSWGAWMSEVVPEKIRGTYFGKRNMISAGCGMVAVLVSGKFITFWDRHFSEDNPYGFIIVFTVGLIAGSTAAYFLSRIPEKNTPAQKENEPFNPALFLKPLKDKNFLVLILFVSAWQFAIQFAGPFYGVFMIKHLKIDFANISVFATVATLATLVMMKIWGPISDNLGNKPILIVSNCFLIAVPFIWIVAFPGNYYLPVLIAHIISGAFMAGAALSQFNILIKFSPQEGRSVYLAIYATITGFFGAIAPMIGSSLGKVLEGVSFNIFAYTITNLHFIFLSSSFLQMVAMFFIFKVNEPKAASPVAVVMRLKNDLNPQTGIVGTTDFVMVNLEKTGNILEKIDKKTDRMAEQSEEKISKILDKGEKIIEKPLKKIRDFFKNDN